MPELREELRYEYTILQTNYEAMDGRVLTIKSWITPLLSAGLGIGLKDHSLGLVLATGLTTFCLWALEGIWKNFQWCYLARIRLLESVFRGEIGMDGISPFQIETSWSQSYKHRRSASLLVKTMIRPFVCLPYLPILAASFVVIVWLLVSPAPIRS